MHQALTRKQKKTLDYINKFIKRHGYSPSYREIAKGLKLSSVATVAQHIKALESKGALTKSAHSARSILPSNLTEAVSTSVNLAILGKIAAGSPIEAISDSSDTLEVPSFLVGGKNSYVLQVKGSSMIEDGIFDGDCVVIEENKSPDNGQVVVALIDSAEATLKRYYKEAGRIRLQPANSTMKPIYINPDTELEIQGVVVGVIRKY